MNDKTLSLLLFGISFTLLAFEIVLLRALSFLQWYHFAYLIISLALFGFAASGTLFVLFRNFWLNRARKVGLLALLLTGISMAACRHLLAYIPMDSFLAVWHPSELIWPALLGLLLFLPFLFGAFFIILCLSLHASRIGVLYGANLLGSGAGSLGALFLLYLWHPLTIPYVLALATTALGLLLIRRDGTLIFIATLGLALIAWLGLNPSEARMSQYKPLARALLMPETEIRQEAFDPMGVISVVRSPHLRSAEGLALSYQGDIPPRPMVFHDGSLLGALPTEIKPGGPMPILHSLLNLPYMVRSPQKALVLEAGTGTEIQRAQMHGVRDVTAVEKNRNLLRLLATGIPEYVSIYKTGGVRTIISGSRGFLRRDENLYDLIVVPPVEGLAGMVTGMQSLYENYLLTVEAVSGMHDRLSDRGMLAVSAWLDEPPRRPLKLFALLAETLREKGVNDPGLHLVAVRSWNMVIMLMSKCPINGDELGRAAGFAEDEGFDILYPPVPALSEERLYHRLADNSLPGNLAGLAATPAKKPDSPFYLSPPTDERPYFAHFITLRALPYMWQSFGVAGLVLLEWSYVLLGITLILLGLAGFCLVLLPLWLWQRRRKTLPRPSRRLIYFAAIGAGFMFVEILFIQKLVLILDEPVYAVDGVVATLLVFASVGSMLSARISSPPGKIILWSVAGLLLLLTLFHVLLPVLSEAITIQTTTWRSGFVIAILAPPALVMGLFFPTGIRALEQAGGETLIPWAWGINGFVSIISAPLATLSSLNFGFIAMGAMGMAFYLLAAFCRPAGTKNC